MASLVPHVGLNHGRADIFVSHQFLNRADVVSGFQQVSGEGMPEGMAADMLDHSGFSNGLLDRLLKDRLVKMVAPFFPSFPVSSTYSPGERPHRDEHGRRGLPIAVGSHSLKHRIGVDGGADGIMK